MYGFHPMKFEVRFSPVNRQITVFIDFVLHIESGYSGHYTIETLSTRDNLNSVIDGDGSPARDLFDLPGGEYLWRSPTTRPKHLEQLSLSIKCCGV
jgi:hypothetical protein